MRWRVRVASLGVVVALVATGCRGGSDPTTDPAPPAVGWGPPVVLPAPAPPSSAAVAERPDGSAVAVWVDRQGAAAQVMSAERDAQGIWSPGVRVGAESPTPIQGARVAVDSDGVATAVWALWDRPGGAVFAFVQSARQAPDGAWEEVQTLSRGTNGVSEILAAALDDGRFTVVWSGSERRNGSYVPEVRSATRSASGTWSFARVASRTRGDGYLPPGGLAAVPGEGSARLIWSTLPRPPGGPGQILTSTLDARGAWSTPRAIAPTGPQASDLAVATGTDGTTTAAWRTGTGTLRVARTSRAGWSTPRSGPGGPVTGRAEIAAGSGGEALVVVEGAPVQGRSELRALRIDRSGSFGPIRTLARRSLPPPPLDELRGQWSPAVAIDTDGRAVVAWTASRTTSDGVGGVRARLVTGAGNWGPLETVSTFSSPVASVTVSADALTGGEFQVRWQADRNPDVPPQASIRTN
ncbi:MAG: hypothetical protein AB7I38_16000 [Dehalococcoidia bacterium]